MGLIFKGALAYSLFKILIVIFVIIGIIVGAFFFLGAPIYALLNLVEKLKNNIKDNYRIKHQEDVFKKYDEELAKTIQTRK